MNPEELWNTTLDPDKRKFTSSTIFKRFKKRSKFNSYLDG